MGKKAKILFERGRFFIETGTARGFAMFVEKCGGLVRLIPGFVLKRISDLMDSGDRTTAVTLWMKACEEADKAIVFNILTVIYTFFHILVAIFVVYGVYCFIVNY